MSFAGEAAAAVSVVVVVVVVEGEEASVQLEVVAAAAAEEEEEELVFAEVYRDDGDDLVCEFVEYLEEEMSSGPGPRLQSFVSLGLYNVSLSHALYM